MISCKSYMRLSAFICVLSLLILHRKTQLRLKSRRISAFSLRLPPVSVLRWLLRGWIEGRSRRTNQPHRGLPANGLGVTDIATRATIGGLFKEFVSSVKEHYVKLTVPILNR